MRATEPTDKRMTTDSTTQAHRQAFERRALHGLACEWKRAVAELSEPTRTRMRPPLFVLADFSHRWGIWNPERREIAIRRSLIWDYPWTAVREVLLHEMAHQLADEAWGGDGRPHGEAFRDACRTLRADPGAAGNYVPFALRNGADDLSDDDRILLRVRKLLALAQSANPHEAEAAMAKAHEQIARHNVDLLATLHPRAYASACVGAPVLRCLQYDYALANLLCDFYFVEGIWIPAYVPARGRMGRVLEISGLPENVKMAGYVHDFLRRVIDDQWAAFNADARHTLHRKTDFAVGLVQGFRQKIEAQERGWRTTEASTWALVKSGDERLRGYFRKRYPRIRRIAGRARRIDRGVHKAGERAGRATVLTRPIEGGRGSRSLLLGG